MEQAFVPYRDSTRRAVVAVVCENSYIARGWNDGRKGQHLLRECEQDRAKHRHRIYYYYYYQHRYPLPSYLRADSSTSKRSGG